MQTLKVIPKIISIIILVSIGYFGYTQFFAKTYISSDITLKELKIDKGKTMVVKNGAKITVLGNAKIDGSIECEGGPIKLITKGSLQVANKVECNNQDMVALVAQSGIEFGENAQVISSGNVFLVDSEEHIPDSQEAIDKLFEETGMDTNDGKMRIGPLGSDEENIDKRPKSIDAILKNSPVKILDSKNMSKIDIVKTASAKDDTVVLNGNWKIDPPKKGINNPVFFVNFPGRSLEINGSLSLPKGRDAETVKGGCDIQVPDDEEEDELKNKGKKNRQKDAPRARFRAEKVTIGSFTLTLGDGGKGADAETDQCFYAVAVAGTGGKSGNLKITAGTEIIIKDRFTIIPGKGGKGGNAIAYGKKGNSGNPGGNGGYAGAGGGYGANNDKKLKFLGDARGLDKIFIGSVIGGDGGDGIANPGDGGDGDVCDSKGGLAGYGYVEEGFGGMPFLELLPQVKRVKGAKDELGKGGKTVVNEANSGKDGPPCNENEQNTTSTPAPKKTDNSTKGLTARLKFTPDSGTNKAANATQVEFITNQYSPPYTFDLKVDGKVALQGTISESDCTKGQEFTSCVLAGFKFDPSWNNNNYELTVYDKTGKRQAGYGRKASSGSSWRPSCTGSDCPPPFAQPLP